MLFQNFILQKVYILLHCLHNYTVVRNTTLDTLDLRGGGFASTIPLVVRFGRLKHFGEALGKIVDTLGLKSLQIFLY